jgi:PAS domain S-box-containing protein
MKSIASFSHEIEQGNLHVEYHLASKNDLLGNSIKEMQNSLIKATEENEKRKEEDRRITWTTSGIAKFSELLRQNSNDVDEFSYTIISNLVEYLQANQGAIFLINDRNPRNLYIEKKGAYAYSNRKYDEQSFEMGIGLVGRCILEAQTIFLTDIPQDYITITSGIGQANPNCLVLIPLKYNDVIYGVIEIASFKVIESYQISFLEKIGESIASSISIIKTNTQTAKLLDESQMQSEMLSSQEEEMRQNLEEMRATQEQLQVAVERSKDKEYELIEITQKQKKAIDAFERVFDSISYPIYYKDVNGKYMSCNSAYADVIGFEKNEIIGRTDFQFLSFEDAQKVEEREKNILRDKTDYAQKSLFTTKSGNVFNGLLSKKVFYDKSNRLAGIIGILIPINIIDIIKK